MKIVKLLREWAWYKEGSIVIISNAHADWLSYTKACEIIVSLPTFAWRMGFKGKKMYSPLDGKRVKELIEDLELQIEYGKEAIEILKNLELST